jgi:NADH dehydrogenase [ubiquinone] 1 alpha subcomplex assembly factor 7
MMLSLPQNGALLTPLAKKLAARIAAGGPVSFHDYMEACLYDPGHGYYKKRDPIGGGGDFVTAPEISQVFGELTGLWAGETWRLMGEPDAIELVELGPGRGTLMADALRALRVLPGFLKCVRVHFIETSEPMRNAQKTALAGAVCPVFWHSAMEEVPEGPAIVIANEFFDCLPVRQFIYDGTAQLWRERMVALKDGSFEFALSSSGFEVPPHPVLLPSPERGVVSAASPDHEDGDVLETRPATSSIVEAFAARAARAPFAALIVDYGYAQPSDGDTVQAVKQHRFAGVFDSPGETDLTAHVDFPGLVSAAKDRGLRAFGPMPMGEWLLRLGLEARVSQLLKQASEREAIELRSRIARLVDPAQMGVLFKAAALAGGVSGPLPPF